jgi:hypothetical protein
VKSDLFENKCLHYYGEKNCHPWVLLNLVTWTSLLAIWEGRISAHGKKSAGSPAVTYHTTKFTASRNLLGYENIILW